MGFITVLAWRVQWGVKRWVAAAAAIVIPVLLLSGWLWWRNWTLYGDPTAATVFVRLAGGDRHYTLWQVLAETPSLWTSFFAVFGWFNVRAPDWVVAVWNGVVGVSVLGWMSRLVSSYQLSVSSDQLAVTSDRSKGQKLMTDHCLLLTLLAGWVLLVYAGLVSFMLQTPTTQGRLLFPALIPLVVGVVSGFRFQVSGWAAHIWRHVLRIIPVLALLTTLYCLFVVIPQAYARPQTVDHMPDAAAFPPVALNDDLHLLGAAMETTTAQPGEPVWFTLYWQAERQPTIPPEQVVEFFGLDLDVPVGRLHSYHGRGLYPATLWPVGEIVADHFAVRLNEAVDAPVLATGYVRIVRQGDGVPFGTVKIVPESGPPAPIQYWQDWVKVLNCDR
ncbi:MAG: hypothetical protein IPL78_29575 [Chloroflexi bacterium]|nr:hypothetical protein [Chloroflexota bacterium]